MLVWWFYKSSNSQYLYLNLLFHISFLCKPINRMTIFACSGLLIRKAKDSPVLGLQIQNCVHQIDTDKRKTRE